LEDAFFHGRGGVEDGQIEARQFRVRRLEAEPDQVVDGAGDVGVEDAADAVA
jgi:hypothetical protein